VSLGARRNQPCKCGSGKKAKLCCFKVVDEPKKVAMQKDQEVNAPALVVLMPSRGRVTTETLVSMGHLDGLKALVMPVSRKGVVEARNELAKDCLRIPAKAGFIPKWGWFCLWVDDDAFWRPGTVLRLMKALADPQIDIVAGWFCGRSAHAGPKAYKADGAWPRPGVEGDCSDGDIVEVARVGFHFVLHRMEILEQLGDNPFSLDNGEPGEDLAFCKRARDAGKRIWVHTGCPVAHVDDDGIAYLPGEGPMRVVGAQLQKTDSTRTYGLETATA
jgi:SEC-C motif